MRSIARRAPETRHVGADHPLVLELHHLLLEAAADLADRVRHRHAHVLEHELGGVAGAVAHLGDLPADAEAGSGRRHDDHRHAGVAALVARAREQAEPVGLRAVGDPHLAAVDDPVVAVAHGAGADAGDVAAGVGLGHRDGADHLAAERRLEVGLLQLVAAEAGERGRGHGDLHGDRHRHAGAVGATELLGEHHRERVVGALAAVRPGRTRGRARRSRRASGTARARGRCRPPPTRRRAG